MSALDEAYQASGTSAALRRARSAPALITPQIVPRLQRTIGNRHTIRLLPGAEAAQRSTPGAGLPVRASLQRMLDEKSLPSSASGTVIQRQYIGRDYGNYRWETTFGFDGKHLTTNLTDSVAKNRFKQRYGFKGQLFSYGDRALGKRNTIFKADDLTAAIQTQANVTINNDTETLISQVPSKTAQVVKKNKAYQWEVKDSQAVALLGRYPRANTYRVFHLD
jgi:hypothetical protein